MNSLPVIAIFDIGKTNKKFFLLDTSYQIVHEQSITFPEIHDDDGDACEDIKALTNWITKTFTGILSQKEYDVKAINFSAYGASFVYIDAEGKVIAPLYNYLKDYPAKLKNAFYKKYGGEENLSCETASPVLGSLNSGMQLHRVMHENPALYKKIKYALHLPQYVSFVITRKMVSDITSIGCHTLLWDFKKNNYHRWVKEEGWEKKLAPVKPSGKAFNIKFNNKTLKAGPGLHDSSAALIPYLAVFKEPFILISTGTWCISLNPFNKKPLTVKELKNDCLCYLDYKGKPVKASRLFGGYVHEQQIKRIAKHFRKHGDFYKSIKYDASIIQHLADLDILKNKFEDSDHLSGKITFEKRQLKNFKNYEESYHCLIHDIMQQQFISTKLVLQNSNVKRIFVDGGFSNNSIYMHLLAFAFPQLEVYAASVAQATAMGAALAIHTSWNPLPVPADMVKLTYYEPLPVM
ncbi:carbohydrate kinase [Ginsengibacter hankyongi]|uniref:Carbohydrate kinase n=1 Tax=Ginsengibacter hankyongi TaxID=2607284 RepID=A0A5J5IDU7_9BACT|nr:FGGY family carbohydrate kinase [Ginsengibacter hankyongi]KAA9037588.1 carbohydrate kinase [Ginsengibacter hankyongi]